MIIRAAGAADAAAIAAIYGHHVLTGLGTFEAEPPTADEMARRVAAVQALGLPYLVAEDGEVIGHAYAAPFRPRISYRYTAEDSIYLAPDAIGKGIGRALLAAVIAQCEALGLRQMIAVIGDSANAASIGLHRALGFEAAGMARSVGYKHDRWVDIVFMQRALNEGDGAAPTRPGLKLGGG